MQTMYYFPQSPISIGRFPLFRAFRKSALQRKLIQSLLLILLCPFLGISQMSRVLEYSENGYYEFSADSEIISDEFFSLFGRDLGLGTEDEMRLEKSREDDYGNAHNMYQRYYKEIRVESDAFTIHAKNGKVFSANGKLGQGLSLSINPSISEEAARDLAISDVESELFAWEDSESEKGLKMENGEAATYFPKGELIIRKIQSDKYVLTWKFYVSSLIPFEDWFIYINANSGDIIERETRINNCNPYNGSTNTLYNGVQPFKINNNSWSNNFSLNDCDRDIHTKIFVGPTLAVKALYGSITPQWWSYIADVKHPYANWGNTFQVETSAHWIAQESWDYLHSRFNWRGLDGQGRRIRILTQLKNWGSGELIGNNFFVNARELVMIGALPDGNGGFRHMSSIHHVAHEIFHGVVINTANLDNTKEQGSLHEAYCDIFGVMVEKSATGNINWVVCSDVATASENIRNFEDPNSSANPAIIGDDFYQDQNCGNPGQSNDFCFKHLTASIPGRAFNLLAGSANPSQNGVFVPGIGEEKAFNIAFRALRDGYLQKTSNFADAREAWKAVARMIYGPCSLEEYAVQNAWGAVGVGNKNNLCTEILGPSIILDCNNSVGLASFRASAPQGAQITWNLPSNWNYSISGSKGEFLRLISLPNGTTNGTISVVAKYQGTRVNDYLSFSLRPCLQQQRIGDNTTSWNLYPNPALHYSLLETDPSLLGGKYFLTDIKGKRLLRGSIERPLEKIGFEGLSPGLYFLTVQKDSFQSVKKLQIIR